MFAFGYRSPAIQTNIFASSYNGASCSRVAGFVFLPQRSRLEENSHEFETSIALDVG
jgi:hypothetical protein